MTTTEQPMSLADVRAADVAARAGEVDRMVTVLDWLDQHLVDPRTSDDAALRDYGDGELLLAGDGAPAVSEAAVVELLAALELPDSSGRPRLGKMLELKYRLPRLWRRVRDLEVAMWRALLVAERTMSLPLDGAAFVDNAVAGFAHSLSWSQLERTVERARAQYDPEEVERRRTMDPRRFDVHTGETGIDGYAQVDGLLDVADALDLDAALSTGAAQLAGLGCEETLDVRRSMAAGQIARAQLALDLHDHHRIDSYTPTDPIKERVRLTWRQCVFPYCTRRARRCDHDHRLPHNQGGPTCPCNLDPLCRTHHRMKTFNGWTYQPTDTTETGIPTAFTWTSPHGHRFRVDRHGSSPEP